MANSVTPRAYDKIVKQFTVSYGTSPTPLEVGGTPADLILVVPAAGNTGSTFWGGADVTVAIGVPVLAYPEGEAIPINGTGKVYLVSDQDTQSARVTVLRG